MPTSFKFELIIFEYHCVFGWNSTVLNILNIHLAHLNLYLIHHPSLFLCFFIFLFFIVSHLLFVFFDCLLILLKLFIYSIGYPLLTLFGVLYNLSFCCLIKHLSFHFFMILNHLYLI